MQLRRLPEAEAAFERALVIRPADALALANLAGALLIPQSRLQEADTRLRQALKLLRRQEGGASGGAGADGSNGGLAPGLAPRRDKAAEARLERERSSLALRVWQDLQRTHVYMREDGLAPAGPLPPQPQ